MSLEEVFGIAVLAALVAFCAGWSMGDTTGYGEGYYDGWKYGRSDLVRSVERHLDGIDKEEDDD